MKLRHISVALLLAVLAGVSFFQFTTAEKDQALEMQVWKKKLKKAAKQGTKDDPEARVRWELNRLKDPATGRIPANIRAKELSFAETLPKREDAQRLRLSKGEQASAALTWSKRGPANVGGRTRAFKADVTDANTIIAGGVSGGLWRSTDDGATWTKTTAPTQLHSVTSLAQDTRAGQEDVWYAGSGERFGNSASAVLGSYMGGGIYKSTDNGLSWSILSSTSSPPQSFTTEFDFVHNVVVDPSDGEVYAAASNIIVKSTNGGTSWSTVRGSIVDNSPTDVAVTSAGVVYAALNSTVTNAGIWRSPDGVTWTQINSGVSGFPTAFARIAIAVAPSNENAVYFLIEDANGTDGVDQINSHQLWKYTYVSGDGSGANGTWVNKGVSLPNESGLDGNAVFDSQGGYDLFVKVKPDNENFVIIGGTVLYKTADFSASTPTWTRIGGYATKDTYASYAGHHADQHSGFFQPGSNVIYYSGHDGGLSKTTDITAGTVSWSTLNNGYTTSQFYTVAIDHATASNAVIVGGLQDNGTWWTNTTSATTDWVDLFGGDGAYCAIADGRSSYYLSSQNGNAYRVTLDGSGNWTNWANIQPTGATGYQFINPFVLDPNDTDMMYLSAGDRIWRNSDLTGIATQNDVTTTTNWTQMTNTSVTGDDIVSLVVSRTPANRLYYGTFNFSNGNRNLYRVDNANSGNPTPTDITSASFPSLGYISCIAVDPTNGDNVMVVFSNYSVRSVWHSTNGGTSWTDVSGGLEQNPDGTGNGPSVRWATIVPSSGGSTYLVATSTGVYSTTTLNGASTVWALEGASVIGNVVVDMIDSRPSDGLVVAATHGNGVYSANVAPAVSVEPIDDGIPRSFALLQNYPNPFNPETRIPFSLSQAGHVKLSIVDLAGREVKRLVDESKGAGNYEARWDGTNSSGFKVASGVYFYRIETAAYRALKRMVLLK